MKGSTKLLALALATLVSGSAQAASVTATYGYDAIGRLTAVQYSNGQQAGYSYDAAGNLVQVNHNGSGAANHDLTWTVSGWGQVTRNPAGTNFAPTSWNSWIASYPEGTPVTLTAAPPAGGAFAGWSGACSGMSLTCNVTMGQARSVGASFTTSGSGGVAAPIPLSGTGTGSVSGTLPPGGASSGGALAATVSGGGSGQWVFTSAAVIPPPPTAALPAGYDFPYGLLDFQLSLGQAGTSATVVLTYPAPLPPGTVYWKYGRTQTNPTPHWYVLNNAQITGNTISFSLTDGGIGDDDLSVNGFIRDPGGPGTLADSNGGTLAPIPVLGPLGLMLLSGLLAWLGFAARRR